jgi:hypothetical protein
LKTIYDGFAEHTNSEIPILVGGTDFRPHVHCHCEKYPRPDVGAAKPREVHRYSLRRVRRTDNRPISVSKLLSTIGRQSVLPAR